jgi:acetyl-CoA C-acetyltransferase
MPAVDVVILSAARTPIGRYGGSFGHPIGCTGARIVVTLLHEPERRHARLGLATLCVSGGMGMAVAIERIASCA